MIFFSEIQIYNDIFLKLIDCELEYELKPVVEMVTP